MNHPRLLDICLQLKLVSRREFLMVDYLVEKSSAGFSSLDKEAKQFFFELICVEDAQGNVRLEWTEERVAKIFEGIFEEYDSFPNQDQLDFEVQVIKDLQEDAKTLLNHEVSTDDYIKSSEHQGVTYYYLQRNQLAEQAILKSLDHLLHREQIQIDQKLLKQSLENVFGAPYILPVNVETKKHFNFHERQVKAAYLAALSPFFIISGGPGTGKTAVLVQVLRTLLRTDKTLAVENIALSAPTGRAKARMGESLASSLNPLEEYKDDPQMGDAIQKDLELKKCKANSFTLHSLLDKQLKGSKEKLPYKLIVIDEFSMVDIHLFSKLVESITEDCRLILLGDMHQLPPVGHGSVLGDMSKEFTRYKATLSQDCADAADQVLANVPQESMPDDLGMVTEIQHKLLNKIVVLTKSQRSSAGIMALANVANYGEVDRVEEVIQQEEGQADSKQIQMISTETDIEKYLPEFLARYFTEEWKSSINQLQDQLRLKGAETGQSLRFVDKQDSALYELVSKCFEPHKLMRVLCLSHNGNPGTKNLNQVARKYLNPQVKDPSKRISGELVMVTRNQKDLGLYNGDAGICIVVDKKFYAVFDEESRYRFEPIERIHHLETAFAISVHKSQGSEYDHILMTLPERKTKLLTREILYTGLTRAKTLAEVYGDLKLFKVGVARSVERPSGISQWLEG